jgi:hypothetical protein
MNNTQRNTWTGNGTRRDRSRVGGYAATVVARVPVKRTDVLSVEVAGRGVVEVGATTFLRYTRRFPTARVRVETYEDMPDGTFQERVWDTFRGVDTVRTLGNN